MLLSERSDFNAVAVSLSEPGGTGIVSEALQTVCCRITCTVAETRINTKVGRAATVSALLEVSAAWAWLVDGRLREEGGSSLVACTWRRRCRALRDAVERSVAAAESISDIQQALARATAAAEERGEQLQTSVRRVRELEEVLYKQKALLVAAEDARVQERARAQKDEALQREVEVLREALEVLEGRLESATQEGRRSQSQATAGSGGGAHWDAGMEGPSTTALRGALLVGRAWQSLVLKKFISELAPLPTVSPMRQTLPDNVSSNASETAVCSATKVAPDSGNAPSSASHELRKLLREVNGARASGAVVVRLKSLSPGTAANALIAHKIASERKAIGLARRVALICAQQQSVDRDE